MVDISADGNQIVMGSSDAAIAFGHENLAGSDLVGKPVRPATAPAGMITRAHGEGEEDRDEDGDGDVQVVDGEGRSVMGSDSGSVGRFGGSVSGHEGGFSGGNVPATMDDMRMNYRLK